MALEKVPRSDHELAHAVHGPTYRANHARIFGERRFPKIAENAEIAEKVTPSHFEFRNGIKIRVFDDPRDAISDEMVKIAMRRVVQGDTYADIAKDLKVDRNHLLSAIQRHIEPLDLRY